MSLQGPHPEYGDLIEFFRPVYTHWGVYVGNGYVVHLSDLDGLSSLYSAFGCVIVKKEPLWLVANGDIYRVNNKDGKNRKPYPPKIIVKRALEEVGELKEYSLTSYNCEHFATKLRYGTGFSDQVRDAAICTAGATAALVLAGVVAGAIYCIEKDKRQRE
ncbi:phospholipase A and acyltransferase 2-like [Hyla sarda]|uniref:phospholipase A and acyltransferase 2-like n=1 Tax=Hyla sarda TaxID=327740 RepID=UPI0024C26E60|nr:phospholipase A and acyltransferase 2-like [Hyla sarda]XP_056382945.1 phospholipase A and acyltransferase 2-like [Hyla sarda]XP_056382946.1 phospholipase A and acyltransferase 2-like [Hyla sarda]XP_056382947.1 phospholipase A and acyltransferase 2-like [Hyla sarda]XP_056382948.1 phospholipase A and acyltransferase 2-like [Hyla sarda]XP_056382949.1 phospholipase A and acyltransferase 2-like [Hyla sarda]XP_056382950.1 phospholipase A and acyltransferase 2-like [Hyla sarda]XP_056382951.1 pho